MRFIEGKPFNTLKAYNELITSKHKYFYIVKKDGHSICTTKEKLVACLEWFMEYKANVDELIPVFNGNNLDFERTKAECNIDYISTKFFMFGETKRRIRTEETK